MTSPAEPPQKPLNTWRAGRFALVLDRPLVMGIVNVTPDSFSDGGRFASHAQALAHCDRLLTEGADILDIGGESTRPGARKPSAEEELQRVLPVIEYAVSLGCPVSLDSSEPVVMRAALERGADILNDVRAFQRPGALELVAVHETVGLCVMHMQGEPGAMQAAPAYGDVVAEVKSFLSSRRSRLQQAGVGAERMVLDPGFGFGKTHEHNLALAQALREIRSLGSPLLVGWSRKSSLGRLTGRDVDARLVPSVAAALASVAQGADVLRVHDVLATVDALKIWKALGPAPSAK